MLHLFGNTSRHNKLQVQPLLSILYPFHHSHLRPYFGDSNFDYLVQPLQQIENLVYGRPQFTTTFFIVGKPRVFSQNSKIRYHQSLGGLQRTQSLKNSRCPWLLLGLLTSPPSLEVEFPSSSTLLDALSLHFKLRQFFL